MAKRTKNPSRRLRTRNRHRRSRRAPPSGIGTTLALISKVIGSYFPTSSIFVSKLTNFALRSIGVAQTTAVADGKLVMSGLKYSAAQARFGISPRTILGTMPGAFPVKVKYSSDSTGNDKFDVENARHYFCPYREARFKHVTITVEPTNTVSTSQGMMYVALVPFVNQDVETNFSLETDLSVEEFQHFPIRSIGRYGKPVVLQYTPSAHDGNTFQFSPLHDVKFGVLVYYLDQNRSSPTTFSHNDVAFCVKVTGNLDLRTPRISPLSFELSTKTKQLSLNYTDSLEDIWLFRDEIKDYGSGSTIKDLRTGELIEIDPSTISEVVQNGIKFHSADLCLVAMD